MPEKTDVRAISRIASALAELPEVQDRRQVVGFIDGAVSVARAKVALRVAKLVAELDGPSRERVLEFFSKQLAERTPAA